MNSVSRRTVLGTLPTATTLLSGCVFGGSVPGGHLFLENRLDRTAEVALSVTERTNGGERILHHRYDVPARHAVQFDGILESGNDYEIRALQPAVPDVYGERLAITVEACDPGDPSEKLDVAILATTSGLDIVTYDCDRDYGKADELTYVDPAEVSKERLTEEITTETPE